MTYMVSPGISNSDLEVMAPMLLFQILEREASHGHITWRVGGAWETILAIKRITNVLL